MSVATVSFKAAPVVEVVAGVAFDALSAEMGALLGAFWKERLRGRFPGLEQQPPYFPTVEQFTAEPGAAGFSFDRGGSFPTPRLWASSKDGQELLQLQPGWFACNWRKVSESAQYDRWLKRRNAFEHWYQTLESFLGGEGTGKPTVSQCEVTYINHIRSGGVWNRHSDIDRVFSASLSPPGPYRLEQLSAQAQFVLEDDGEPYGRLHAKVMPAFALDGKTPLYVFELTARGAPLGEGLAGALEFLDRGRHAINRAFLAMTTEEMHAEWGREDDGRIH
jgi:uncharacterized protein (TIGR04255 family)